LNLTKQVGALPGPVSYLLYPEGRRRARGPKTRAPE